MGYQVLDLIIVMMIVDFLTVGGMFHLERGSALIKNNPINIETDIMPRLQKIDKIDAIEETSKNILNKVSNSGFSNFEEKLKNFLHQSQRSLASLKKHDEKYRR